MIRRNIAAINSVFGPVTCLVVSTVVAAREIFKDHNIIFPSRERKYSEAEKFSIADTSTSMSMWITVLNHRFLVFVE
ncbi:hypothetical protein DM860_015281 [Cuscuta australis]|uniref:Uncharacterized protein n=1 Tax=Cuscuta australis TaxID=267555 RepID=A0A328D1P4_9ASTE|nr:hypothetical protein DM860_015281 [Cuscuta australis]